MIPDISKIVLAISIIFGARANENKPKSLLPFKENVMNFVPIQIVSNIDQYYVKDRIVSDANIDIILKSVAKDIVDALLQRQDAENKLTDLVAKLLNSTDNKRPTNAIENRRILDYISKKSASYIETYANNVASQDLRRLVTGLAHVSSEIAITAALKDISWTGIISKRNSLDLISRRRRSIPGANANSVTEKTRESIYSTQSSNLNTVTTAGAKLGNFDIPSVPNTVNSTTEIVITKQNITEINTSEEKAINMYSIFSPYDKIPIKYLINVNETEVVDEKPFINKSDLDSGKRDDFDRITLYQAVNQDHSQKQSREFDILYDIAEVIDVDVEDGREATTPTSESKPTTDYLSNYFSDEKDDAHSAKSRRYQARMKHLENKANRAIAYSSDVAFFTAATLIATRRTMTASLEVVMAVKMAADGVLDRKTLMTSLAKVAAQEAAKEARNANIKAQSCQKVLNEVMKYTTQAVGAKSYGTANRISMDSISLAAISRSMAAVALEVAMNTLFETNSLNE